MSLSLIRLIPLVLNHSVIVNLIGSTVYNLYDVMSALTITVG